MVMFANMGGLSSSFVVSSFGRGEAIMALSSEFIRTPLNEAVMSLSSTWVPILDGSISTSTFEEAIMGMSSQFNFIQITQGIAATQSSSDFINLLKPLQDDITIGSVVKRVSDVSIIQPMGLTHETPDNLLSAFEVAQAIAFSGGLGVEHALELSQLIDFNVNLVRPLQSDLGITSDISGFKVYTNGSVAPIPPQSIPVADQTCEPLDRAPEFIITELVSGDTVTMKHPVIGDILEVNSLTIDKSSRGNVDLSFVPPLHNQFIVRRLQFQSVPRGIKTAYQGFLQRHAGLRMSIITPEGKTIFGHVTNLDTEFTDQSRNLRDTECFDPELQNPWSFEMLFLETPDTPLWMQYGAQALWDFDDSSKILAGSTPTEIAGWTGSTSNARVVAQPVQLQRPYLIDDYALFNSSPNGPKNDLVGDTIPYGNTRLYAESSERFTVLLRYNRGAGLISKEYLCSIAGDPTSEKQFGLSLNISNQLVVELRGRTHTIIPHTSILGANITLAVVWTGAILKVYWDGQPIKTLSTGFQTEKPYIPFVIGGRWTAPFINNVAQGFNGRILNVELYDKDLTDDEILKRTAENV